jgi:hypothetical protein
MKRIGRFGSTARIVRWTWSIVAVEPPASGGVNLPSSRKDRALERRRREDAEGDRRIMGSGRRVGTFWLSAREGLVGILEELDWDFFWMKGTASLRTWEKS